MRAVRLTVKGRVQRVGYPRHILDTAQELGIAGYAKNEKDGSVTIFAQAKEETIRNFLERAQNPPPPAQVKSTEIREAKPNPRIKTFEIKYGKLADELQEGFGATQTIFMNYWAEFRDYRQEFRDYRQEFKDFSKRTDENFKSILERYGEISEKLTRLIEMMTEESKKTTEMLETMRREFIETRERLDNSLALLREAVEKLSPKPS